MESSAALTNQMQAGDAAKVQPAAPEAFTSHMSQLDAGVLQCTMRVLKMNGSTMLFINDKNTECLEQFAVAMPSRASNKQIVSTTFMGESGQCDSLVLATKLSSRYNRQFYVSLNLKLDQLTRSVFEKALVSYMQDNLKIFV